MSNKGNIEMVIYIYLFDYEYSHPVGMTANGPAVSISKRC